MNDKTNAKGGQTLTIMGAAAVAVGVAIAYLTGLFDKDAPAPEPVTLLQPAATDPAGTETAKPEPAQSEAPPAAQPEPAPAPEPEQAVVYAPPAFDVVRVEPDGTTLVAGIAIAGSALDILLDGAALVRATAAADGKFAEFLSIAPSDQPRVLSLLMHVDGQQIASDQTVIIAPVAQVAKAEPEQEQETAPQPRPDTQPAPDKVTEPTPAQEKPAQPEMADPGQPAQVASQPAEAQPEQAAAPEAAPEPRTPAVILADKDGVKVIQPADSSDPELQATVAIDAVSYTETGDVTVAGRGKPGMSVLLYLNNASVGGGGIAADGRWETVLTGIAPGLYTLRADEVDAAGKVLSRIETPFLREAPEKVVAVVTPQPAPGSEPAAEPTADPEPAADAPVKPGSETASQPETQPAQDPQAAQPAQPAVSQPTPETPAAPAQPAVRVVTVQPGSTLWAIARERYGEGVLYVRVYEANKGQIRNPDLIYPGQVFVVPE